MNKSDFISDAVALDLGKSGVKVAETLEIEVGNEWWRLINAKEQANLYTFTRRMEKQNPYEPGIFDMRDLKESTAVGMQGYSRIGDRSACFLPKMAVTTEGQHIIFQVIEINADKYPTLRFINLTTGTSKIIKGPTMVSAPTYQAYGAWWDATNQAVGWLVSDFNTSTTANRFLVYADKEGNIVYSRSMGILPKTLIYDIQVFPEDSSGTIYSLFWNPVSSTPWIRKTLPQINEYNTNAISVTNVSQTGATVLSAITSADPSHRLSMFYSRVYGSVGIAWFNSGTGTVQFVLEKDGWADVYSLPEMDTSEYVFDGISNIVVPNDGEFLVTDWLTYKVGNIPSPAGYSFPTNVQIFGATPIAGRKAIIWGSSSTTLFRWTLDYDTRSIEYNGVITTEGFTTATDWLFGHRSPTVLHETETKLLLAFRSEDPYIMLYDKTTNTMTWLWSSWQSSAVFPVTYTSTNLRSGIIFMLGNRIMFFNMNFKYTAGIGHYHCLEVSTVSIESMMGCTTVAELSSLIRQNITLFAPFHTTLQKLGPTTYLYDWKQTLSAQNMEAIKMVAEDDNYYYLHLTVGNKEVFPKNEAFRNPLITDVLNDASSTGLLNLASSVDCTIYISKSTMLPVAYYAGPSTISTRSGISTLGINPTQKHKYINVVTDAEGGDMNVKRFNGSGITFKDYQTSNSIKDTNSGGISSLYYVVSQGAVTACPLNKKREALFYAIKGNSIVQYGASTNITGDHGCYTSTLPSLPFSPNCLMIDEWEDFAIALGQITDGYLPYCIFNPRTGFHNKAVAIKIADASTAECILPTADSGGISAMRMYGSLGYAITATGKVDYINTFVSVDYGTGTEPPAVLSETVFDYEERVYIPYPFAREGIKVELSNISKMTKITLPETQNDLIRTMLASGTDFRGSRCVLRRVFPDHVEEGSDIVLLDGYIQDWSYSPDKKGILFTVSKTLIDVGSPFPKRLMNMGCSHVFKGVRCGYLGEDGICTKTKTDCTSKGAVTRFGGFPWVAARQRRVMWR